MVVEWKMTVNRHNLMIFQIINVPKILFFTFLAKPMMTTIQKINKLTLRLILAKTMIHWRLFVRDLTVG